MKTSIEHHHHNTAIYKVQEFSVPSLSSPILASNFRSLIIALVAASRDAAVAQVSFWRVALMGQDARLGMAEPVNAATIDVRIIG